MVVVVGKNIYIQNWLLLAAGCPNQLREQFGDNVSKGNFKFSEGKKERTGKGLHSTFHISFSEYIKTRIFKSYIFDRQSKERFFSFEISVLY